jgi:hypothetical protein
VSSCHLMISITNVTVQIHQESDALLLAGELHAAAAPISESKILSKCIFMWCDIDLHVVENKAT